MCSCILDMYILALVLWHNNDAAPPASIYATIGVGASPCTRPRPLREGETGEKWVERSTPPLTPTLVPTFFFSQRSWVHGSGDAPTHNVAPITNAAANEERSTTFF